MTESDPTSGKEPEDGPLRAAADLAREGIDRARNKAGDLIALTREKGEATLGETREKAWRAAAETNRLFNEHPIAAVAAATAAGAVLGIFMPRVALAARVGKLARGALRTAIASEAAQMLWAGAVDVGKSTALSSAGRAARPASRRATPAPESPPAPPAVPLPPPAEAPDAGHADAPAPLSGDPNGPEPTLPEPGADQPGAPDPGASGPGAADPAGEDDRDGMA